MIILLFDDIYYRSVALQKKNSRVVGFKNYQFVEIKVLCYLQSDKIWDFFYKINTRL